MIFVFGSNTAGIHGAGAAHYARKHHGAVPGQGFGHVGNSYAIPTKSHVIRKGRNYVGDSLDLRKIAEYVQEFLLYAKQHADLYFQVTRIGCGLAGLKDEDIAPMFFGAPSNCLFDTKWTIHFDRLALDNESDWAPDYWGSY